MSYPGRFAMSVPTTPGAAQRDSLKRTPRTAAKAAATHAKRQADVQAQRAAAERRLASLEPAGRVREQHLVDARRLDNEAARWLQQAHALSQLDNQEVLPT